MNETLQALKNRLTARTIDRRQFMSHAISAGATATLATALARDAEAASPKKGGHLNIGSGHGSTTDVLDPGLYENGLQVMLGYGYNGYLTEVDANGSLQPSLAETWEASADASEWTFKLRSGVEFHNGRSLTTEDVVASINHHRGEETSSTAAPLFAAITDIQTGGSDTVIIRLESGNADFPFILSDYHVPIFPANPDGSMNWQANVGCGPYKLEAWEPGVLAELFKHANHWTDAVGHFESIRLVPLVDPNARTAALVAGDVDAIDKVDVKTAGLLGSKPGITVNSVAGAQHYTFPMRTDMPPFNDVNVRRALKWACNRQEMVDKILFGYGAVGNDVPIGSGQRFFNRELPQTEYDPEKAKYYLKQAGLTSLRVDLSAADAAFQGSVDAAVLYQNSARPIGIDINVIREPNDGYWSDVWLKKSWSACYWGGRPVEDVMFSTAYQSAAAWNDTYWSNERFDRLLLAARGELDEAKRRDMYYEMQKILNDEGGAVIPMFASYVIATSDAVGHPEKFASNWDMDGGRCMERWWRA